MNFPVVGVVGGGQLARMMAPAAIELGVGLRVLAAAPTESAALVIPDVVLGSHDDLADLTRFARGVDVVTFDHEHVPPAHLRALQDLGVVVRPGPAALVHAQDKIVMREALTEIGIPCPRWAHVASPDAVRDFGDEVGWPIVVKVSRGGYDGRGVWVCADAAAAAAVLAEVPLAPGAAWLVEEKVVFTRELAAQVARSEHGQAVAYPVVETVQQDGICAEVVAPAPGLTEDAAVQAQAIALRIAGALGVVGMLAVELFDTPGGLLVNELAMRPHNSGHWSIDGAVTSQFENHLRAVLDLPLGAPTATVAATVMVNILGGDHPDLYQGYLHCMARDPGLKFHLYGKEVRPGRKVGHITVTGDDGSDAGVAALRARARHAADWMRGILPEE